MLGIVLSAFRALNPQQLNEADTVTVLIIQMRKMKVYSLTRIHMHLVSGGEAGMTQAVLLKHICLKGQTLLPLMLGKTDFSGLSGHPWTARPKEPAL